MNHAPKDRHNPTRRPSTAAGDDEDEEAFAGVELDLERGRGRTWCAGARRGRSSRLSGGMRRTAPASIACSPPTARCSMSARRAASRSASPAISSPERQSARIARMVAQTASMVFVSTETEAEALLLEANFIKQMKPRYNVLLRDDKSFPYILITGDHAAPQLLQASRRAERQGRLFRALRQRRRGSSHAQRAAARVPAAHLLGQLLREPHAALPAVPDQALLGALHRRNLARRLSRAGRRGARFPVGAQPRDSPPAGRARWRRRPRRWPSRRRRACATASPRFRRSRASRASIRRAFPRPTSSPSPRRRGSSASRCSSSAPIRTGATAPIFRAPTAALAPAEVLDAFLGAILSGAAGAAPGAALA